MAKISVSLEDDLASALRHEAAGNVSQFVARAVQEALARAQMLRALDELDDELGPVDPAIQEEVDGLFAGLTAEPVKPRGAKTTVKAAKAKTTDRSRRAGKVVRTSTSARA
jgi:Arc/MetJ-type ribon-helix-helix transcriptional regulator